MAMVQPSWGEIIEMPQVTTGEDLLRLTGDGHRCELCEGLGDRRPPLPQPQFWNAQGTTALDKAQKLTSPLLPGFSVDVRSLLDG